MGQDYTPASSAKMARLRDVELARQKYDKSYITAAEAREIPNEVLDADPDLAWRVRNSAQDWPENHASATEALGVLEGGEGQTTETRRLTFEELGQGEVNKLP
jgi:hypothetical protein